MRFHDPYVLLLLLLLVPMIWLYIRREKSLRPALRFPLAHAMPHASRSLAVRLRHLPFILRCLGLVLLIVALARPQKGNSEQEVTTHGVDIMLALDCSYTMQALDFQPRNRFYVTQQTARDFITKRPNDRIGLVGFAARAVTKCPLTLDASVLSTFIDNMQAGELGDGTAIGTAIATAARRLIESDAKSRIMILLTDGDNNCGEIPPPAAAAAAGKVGIRIYTIGVGKEGMVPMPVQVQNPWTGQVSTEVRQMQSTLNEPLLREIASTTGGKFFRARDAEELAQIYATIDKLEKTTIKTKVYTTWDEHFYVFLIAGFLMLVLELVLANTRLRRIP